MSLFTWNESKWLKNGKVYWYFGEQGSLINEQTMVLQFYKDSNLSDIYLDLKPFK
jgi:hypothetical protein